MPDRHNDKGERRPVPLSRPVPRQLADRDPVNTLAGTLVGSRDQAPRLAELEGYAIGPALAPSGSARWSCRRELISSFVNTLRRCHSTVRTDRNSWAAISGLDRPARASRAIWAS